MSKKKGQAPSYDQQQVKISPADFYSKEKGKTKLNWFFFEFAAGIQSHIGRSLRIKLKRKGIHEPDITKSCIHYFKQMQRPILDKLSGKSKDMILSYHPIEQYFPALSDKLVDELLTAVGKAWDGLLAMCERCPVRCISEMKKKAPMFDDPFYYD